MRGYEYDREQAAEFAQRITALGFQVYIAEKGTYGFITDATEARVFSFAFNGISATLSGNYGPPSKMSGTGWQMQESPYELKTADDVRKTLYAHPPSFCVPDRRGDDRGWRHLSTVKQYLALYGSSSRFKPFAAA